MASAYSDTVTLTRTVASSFTSATNTKTVQAYSAADLIGKVAGAIIAVAAVVGTGGAAGVGRAGVAGAFAELDAALLGPARDANDSTVDATKQVTSELTLVSDILTAADGSAPPSSAGTISTQTDHSLTLTLTDMTQLGSEPGRGPGDGDRIVYMFDVKVVWMAVNGEVGIHVLGFGGIGANAVHDLLAEEQSLAAGNRRPSAWTRTRSSRSSARTRSPRRGGPSSGFSARR